MKKISISIVFLFLCCSYVNAQTAKDYFDKGKSAIGWSKWQSAIDNFSKAIEIGLENMENTKAFFLRGAAYFKLKQYNKAIADFTKSIEIASEPKYSWDAYNSRGYAYLWSKKWDEAKNDFDKVFLLDESKIVCNKITSVYLACYYWAKDKNRNNALKYLKVAFQNGYSDFKSLNDNKSLGHFLKGLNNTSDFKALIKEYQNK